MYSKYNPKSKVDHQADNAEEQIEVFSKQEGLTLQI
jgi:hypothetical protein